MHKQRLEYIEKHLSPYLRVYIKGYSTQTTPITMSEKLRLPIFKSSFASEALMDLNKALIQ